ncbi:MAG: ferritin family protein [Candidatus Hodarchaeales archaeon]|jgi:rubrerythrin
MISSKELVETLVKNRQLELKNIEMCQEEENQLKNPGAKLMLYQIRMDSTKHAHVLQTLIDIIKEGTPKYIWEYKVDRYIGRLSTEKELRKHAFLEKEMIKNHEDAIKKTENPGIKKILQNLVEDEKRHHDMIMDMIQHLLKLGP